MRWSLRHAGRTCVYVLAMYGGYALLLDVHAFLMQKEQEQYTLASAHAFSLDTTLKTGAFMLRWGVDTDFPYQPDFEKLDIIPGKEGQCPGICLYLKGEDEPRVYVVRDIERKANPHTHVLTFIAKPPHYLAKK